jgi:hypothetical protein
VRLEHRNDATIGERTASRPECGSELGGMMGVVVDELDPGGTAESLESATNTSESRQRLGGELQVTAECMDDRQGSGGIAEIVITGNRERELG